MWTAEKALLKYRGLNDVITLRAIGHSSGETFPYHEVGRAWQKRTRVVFPVPSVIRNTYLPLTSLTFRTMFREEATPTTSDVISIGDLGLGLVIDDSRQLGMSVEAAALFQLIDTSGTAHSIPDWLRFAQTAWCHQNAVFMFNPNTGWRGCFAEHRLWSAVLLQHDARIKTPYSKPVVRGWFPPHVLNDLYDCIGVEFAVQIAKVIAGLGFDGAPDLALYRKQPLAVWFVEVKSATDALRGNQIKMLQELSKIPDVRCQICCPASALKRFSSQSFEAEPDTP